MPSSSGVPHSLFDKPSYNLPPRSPYVSAALQPSSTTIASTSVPVETLISVLQRLEAKLDASDQSPTTSQPPRPDPDPPYGMPWDWPSSSWTPEGVSTTSVAVSIPPWPPATSLAAPGPHTDSFRQGSRNGFGSRMIESHNRTAWDPPRSRIEEFQGQRSSWNTTAAHGVSYHNTHDPASMETLVATRGRVVARFEARLGAQEQCWATAFPLARSESDPPFGRPRTSWDLPEPPSPEQYYSVAEPLQRQQDYYPPAYTHGLTTVTDTIVTSPAMPPPLELHQQPQPEGSTEWQPMTPVLGLSNNFQHNTPYSVPVTSNEEEEFEKWQREVREAETWAEVEIEVGLDPKTEEELVSDVVKKEEELCRKLRPRWRWGKYLLLGVARVRYKLAFFSLLMEKCMEVYSLPL